MSTFSGASTTRRGLQGESRRICYELRERVDVRNGGRLAGSPAMERLRQSSSDDPAFHDRLLATVGIARALGGYDSNLFTVVTGVGV